MRTEKDSMGEMQVPDDALYGASTQRAVLNFEVSDLRLPGSFIKAIGIIKWAAAVTNRDLGLLPADRAGAIIPAALEVVEGKHDYQFVVDLFQTGSGTSTNMNANEIIANRAIDILGGKRGDKSLVHPNDHVNMCQSSNDVIPAAVHIAAAVGIDRRLLPALQGLHESLMQKSMEFSDVIKAGRTHLQDATPITLGQEFSGYASQIKSNIRRLENALQSLRILALGGTAVGTGINAHPDFAGRAIALISRECGIEFSEAVNHFEAQACQDSAVEAGGALKTLAVSLIKIANDIRWLAAGPRCNIAELRLPAVQPGSSIMPGKVNPVICESVMQVAAKVIGNDATIAAAAQHGNFELNTMIPVIAHSLLESIELTASVCDNFRVKCLDGIAADRDRCREYAEKSLATCTSLAPILGYDEAAGLAKRALMENKTVRQVVEDAGLTKDPKVSMALDVMAMTKPGL